jgi:hypothetical protein
LLIPVHENKKLIFANTYEIQELSAWLLLRSQALVFFPKAARDLKARAASYSEKDPTATPAAAVCPPSNCEPGGGAGNVTSQDLGVVNGTGAASVNSGNVTGPINMTGPGNLSGPGNVTGPGNLTGPGNVTGPINVTGPGNVTGPINVTEPVSGTTQRTTSSQPGPGQSSEPAEKK